MKHSTAATIFGVLWVGLSVVWLFLYWQIAFGMVAGGLLGMALVIEAKLAQKHEGGE